MLPHHVTRYAVALFLGSTYWVSGLCSEGHALKFWRSIISVLQMFVRIERHNPGRSAWVRDDRFPMINKPADLSCQKPSPEYTISSPRRGANLGGCNFAVSCPHSSDFCASPNSRFIQHYCLFLREDLCTLAQCSMSWSSTMPYPS